MILLIDNYDSFTWNLVQRIGELDPSIDLRVVRNDKVTVAEARTLKPTHIIISPGPCSPTEAGISMAIVAELAGEIPILGVCLGHQCIGQANGMTVARHRKIMHGKTSEIRHDGHGLFRGVPNPFLATRYHSLVILAETIPAAGDWEISAWTDDVLEDGVRVRAVMGLRRKPRSGGAPLEGVQFHPESFLTVEGPRMLANFLGLPSPVSFAPTA